MPIPYSFNPMGRSRSASGPSGMYLDGTYLKGTIFNWTLATNGISPDADTSQLTDGSGMFKNISELTSFTGDLSSLTTGSYMFQGCSNLTSWTVELPNLTEGSYMFYSCTALTSWTVDLTNLTTGSYMFQSCSGLPSWTVALPNLTDGSWMFAYCSNLTSFTGDLSKLKGTSATNGGYRMFYNCTSLKTFNSALPSLAYGQNMFQGCNLDEASVLRILNSIPTHTDGETHQLHLGKRTNFLNSTDIAALLGTTVPIVAKSNYSYKGWTIAFTT